jgi:molybdate transport system substrate-binding protein
LEPDFTASTGVEIDATFGAVGVTRKTRAGAPCDLVVLTSALIETLQREGHVVPGSAVPLGTARTGIAVRAGESAPDIHDASSLRSSLAGAARLFFPDPVRSTAGIHFADVLRRLGIRDEVADRCATFPNGAMAMHALAQSREPGEIGCTQVTEITYTPGVVLVGALPAGFDLATVYAAAVCVHARNRDSATRFVLQMGSAESRDLACAGIRALNGRGVRDVHWSSAHRSRASSRIPRAAGPRLFRCSVDSLA